MCLNTNFISNLKWHVAKSFSATANAASVKYDPKFRFA